MTQHQGSAQVALYKGATTSKHEEDNKNNIMYNAIQYNNNIHCGLTRELNHKTFRHKSRFTDIKHKYSTHCKPIYSILNKCHCYCLTVYSL